MARSRVRSVQPRRILGDKFVLNGKIQPFLEVLVQEDGRGPGGTFEQHQFQAPGTRLLELRIGATRNDPSFDVTQPEVVLRPFNKISAQELAGATVRDFEFDRDDGACTINGQLADLNNPMVSPALNGPEIWRLRNSSGGWWHPSTYMTNFTAS